MRAPLRLPTLEITVDTVMSAQALISVERRHSRNRKDANLDSSRRAVAGPNPLQQRGTGTIGCRSAVIAHHGHRSDSVKVLPPPPPGYSMNLERVRSDVLHVNRRNDASNVRQRMRPTRLVLDFRR